MTVEAEDTSPFIDYLKELTEDLWGTVSKAKEATGITNSNFSRIFKSQQAVTPEFIQKLTTDLDPEKKEEIVAEYVNHIARLIDPQYYGLVKIENSSKKVSSMKRPKSQELLDLLVSSEPDHANELADLLLRLLKVAGYQPQKQANEFLVEKKSQELGPVIHAGVKKAAEQKAKYGSKKKA